MTLIQALLLMVMFPYGFQVPDAPLYNRLTVSGGLTRLQSVPAKVSQRLLYTEASTSMHSPG